MEKQTCPRRLESGNTAQNEDTWVKDGAHRRCSFCGSIHPDDAIQMMKDGVSVGPTDKNYKAYMGKHGKLYFQHFAEVHMDAMIELVNNAILNVGYPGYFYVAPFFCKRKTA